MNKLFKSVSILAAAAVILPSLARAESKSIYGDDNRLEHLSLYAERRVGFVPCVRVDQGVAKPD